MLRTVTPATTLDWSTRYRTTRPTNRPSTTPVPSPSTQPAASYEPRRRLIENSSRSIGSTSRPLTVAHPQHSLPLPLSPLMYWTSTTNYRSSKYYLLICLLSPLLTHLTYLLIYLTRFKEPQLGLVLWLPYFGIGYCLQTDKPYWCCCITSRPGQQPSHPSVGRRNKYQQKLGCKQAHHAIHGLTV